MRKNKGFALYELIISISFLSIILISMFSIIYSLNNKLHNIYTNNQLETKKTIIYKKIADDFAMYRVAYKYDSDNNQYIFKYYKDEDGSEAETKYLKIDTTNNRLLYGTNLQDSSSIITMDSDTIKINELKSVNLTTISSGIEGASFENSNNYKNILVLTISFTYDSNNSDMKIYCVNENWEDTSLT